MFHAAERLMQRQRSANLGLFQASVTIARKSTPTNNYSSSCNSKDKLKSMRRIIESNYYWEQVLLVNEIDLRFNVI